MTKGDIEIEINPPLAREVWQKVLELARSIGDKKWEARAQGKISYLTFFEGDITTAQQIGTTAFFAAMMLGDIGAQITYYSVIAHGMNEMGRFEEGLKQSNSALKLAVDNRDAGFPFAAYLAKARAQYELKNYSAAKEILERCLEQARLHNSRLQEAYVLILLGKEATAENDLHQAIEFLELAGVLCTERGFYHSLAWSMYELALLYRTTGDLSKAEERAAVAWDAMKRVGDNKYHPPQHLALLADLKARQGKLTEADALYEQTSDITEGMLVTAPSTQSKSVLIGMMSSNYIEHFSLAVNRLKDVKRAFQVLERARGRTVADSLRSSSQAPEQPDPAQQAGLREISRLQLKLREATSRAERKQLLDELFFAEYSSLHPGESMGELARLTVRSEPAALEELQKILRADELVLEYVLNDPESSCLVISKEKADIPAQIWT